MVGEIIDRVYLYKILRKILKGRVKSSLIKCINFFRKLLLERLLWPKTILLFVTNSCQMRCEFCSYKDKFNVVEEQLSLNEIESLAKNFKNLPRLILTGGEPFLREDINNICSIFHRYCKTTYIGIVTNGYLTEKIFYKVRSILEQTKIRYLKIQISLDALSEEHDRLRGTNSAFYKAVETLVALKKLEVKYRNLFLEISSVVTTFLINDIERFVNYFQAFRVPIKFSIIRNAGSRIFDFTEENLNPLCPRPGAIYPTIEQLGIFYKTTKEINDRSEYRFWSFFQQMKFENCLRILKEKRRILPCYAGSIEAVIYDNGDVAFCENIPPIGNLNNCKLDFYSIWNSEKANNLRSALNQCACINGCNIITSMSYDDETLIKVL